MGSAQRAATPGVRVEGQGHRGNRSRGKEKGMVERAREQGHGGKGTTHGKIGKDTRTRIQEQ